LLANQSPASSLYEARPAKLLPGKSEKQKAKLAEQITDAVMARSFNNARRNRRSQPTRRHETKYYAAMERGLDDTRPMTAEQAATLKRLAQAAYELDAFKPNLTRAEADLRVATLAAKLKLLDGPPHTL
jgi:hypothetical protein